MKTRHRTELDSRSVIILNVYGHICSGEFHVMLSCLCPSVYSTFFPFLIFPPRHCTVTYRPWTKTLAAILMSRSSFDPISHKGNDRFWRALGTWMCCWDYPAVHSQKHCWLAPDRWIIQVLSFKPIISLCLLLMCIYYSVFLSAKCLFSNRFLPFVPLQHVGVTMDRCRLKWTVQTGGTATAASTSTLITPSGKVTSYSRHPKLFQLTVCLCHISTWHASNMTLIENSSCSRFHSLTVLILSLMICPFQNDSEKTFIQTDLGSALNISQHLSYLKSSPM